jgi:phage terminase large subunit
VVWSDNPFFPIELERERVYLQSVDPDAYAHVWEGKCRTASDAQIFKSKYIIEEFTPVLPPANGETVAADAPKSWNGPYLGVDWGFAVDPTAAVKCWVHERKLFIEWEAYRVGCDIDRTPALLDTIPDARRHRMRGDSARPETISYLQQHGYPLLLSVMKWKGSVEDGIAHLRSYEKIIIHPRCKHAAEEARLYSYKVDRLSGDILPEPQDAHNHIWDAVRYALQPLMTVSKMGALEFIAEENARRAAN